MRLGEKHKFASPIAAAEAFLTNSQACSAANLRIHLLDRADRQLISRHQGARNKPIGVDVRGGWAPMKCALLAFQSARITVKKRAD
jgi:hypothetical protein